MERIQHFANYSSWNNYIARFMGEASRTTINGSISIQSSDRVLAEWADKGGYVSEARSRKRLWDKLIQRGNW